jgi:hypothetical protein
MGESEIENLREAYEDVGLGVSPALVRLFEPALGDWCTISSTWGNRIGQPQAYPVHDLFAGGIPSHWEVTGAEVRAIKARKRRESTKVVVQGVLRSRPPGTWEVWTLPFVHIWTVTRGQATRVLSYLDGIEICRCAAS